MTTTLTDRYVWAASRSVPEKERTDFTRELRERIGDATDALLDTGVTPADAELVALGELGDPAALAANWTDRPLHLIGPRYFLTWWRLLKLVLAIAVPIITGIVLFAKLLAQAPVFEAIMDALSAGFNVAMGIAFWMTLAFALVDRYAKTGPDEEWTPAELPDLPKSAGKGRLEDLVGSIIFLVVLIAALAWGRTTTVTGTDGEAFPVLDPELWSFWVPWFLGVAVLEVVFGAVLFRRGWSWGLAIGNILLNVAFALPAIWLILNQPLLSKPYLDSIGWPWGGAGDVIVTIVTIAVGVIAIWDSIEGLVKTVRASGTMSA